MLIISEGKMVFIRKEQVHLVTVPTTDNTLFTICKTFTTPLTTSPLFLVLGSYTCGEKKSKSERKRMVDEFMVVCVDRIIASACFDPSVNGARSDCERPPSVNGGEDLSEVGLVECRICQEEDQVQAMEAPCACNGTLKFAHRKCIQRWCNKKGDITCEICTKIFSPNYSIPLARSNPDVMTIDISQTWGQEINLGDSRLLALAAAEHRLIQSEYEDYAAANTSSIVCLRSVALFLLIVLLIRQAMMVTRDFEMALESSKFFNVSVLQFVGFLLPCYAMGRSCCIIQSQRRRQG